MDVENSLIIIHDVFEKEGSEEEIEGLTIIVDGVIKQIFDKVKAGREYDNYEKVLRDVIVEGVDTIMGLEFDDLE